jgi:hypothetical protein
MTDRLDFAMHLLVSLTNAELAKVEQALPLIRRVVRMSEDQATAVGLKDLTDEAAVQTLLDELDADLHGLLGS